MRAALTLGFLIGTTTCTLWPQPSTVRPEFDVASLKPVILDGADTYTSNLGTFRNGVIALNNTTLAECLRFAYDITADDLLSGPDWTKNRAIRFDILAKTAPGTSRSAALLMLQNLLEDRFKLVLRHEPRVMSYYALMGPSTVHKMQPAQEAPINGANSLRPGHIIHKRITMLLLATLISRFTRTPVLDQTGISGFFEVDLEWRQESFLSAASTDAPDPAGGVSISEAVQKQLGLKLERRRGPVDVMVVEHAEKTPLPN